MKFLNSPQAAKLGVRLNTPSPNERTIPGSQILKIREDPPTGVIMECLDTFGSHVGYGSCVKLDIGETGILMPTHVWKDTKYVKGPNGKALMSEFVPAYECSSQDCLILMGITCNWASVVGARAKPLLTTDCVRASRYVLFNKRDDLWNAQAVKVIGADGGMFRVVSDTTYGDSGLPIFDQKNNIVAMHLGVWPNNKYPENRASGIMPVPGLTSTSGPKYTGCETFMEMDEIYKIADGLDEGEEIIIKTRKNDYKAWVNKSSFTTLSITEMEKELRKGPAGLWSDIYDESAKNAVSGNEATRSTPGKQSPDSMTSSSAPTGSGVPKGKPAKPATSPTSPLPAKSDNGESGRPSRRSQMTPEQKSADNKRRRAAKAAKVKKQAPPPLKNEPISIAMVSEMIQKAVSSHLHTKPRASKPYSRVSTGGKSPKRSRPQASKPSGAVPSPAIKPLPKGSQSGGKLELRPQRPSKSVVKATAGQTQGQMQS